MNFGADPKTDASNFLRLKAGESVVGCFAGEPFEYWNKWQDKVATKVLEGTDGARFRFRINFVTKEGTQMVSKIWEQGPTVYQDLKALEAGGYDLAKTIVTISRTGSTMNDTVYNVMPHPKSKEWWPNFDKARMSVALHACDVFDEPNGKTQNMSGPMNASDFNSFSDAANVATPQANDAPY